MAEPERTLSFLRHLPITQAALVWAVRRHAGQRRETDGAAFVAHPIEVASGKLCRHRESLWMLEAELLGGRMVELLRDELEALDGLPRPA